MIKPGQLKIGMKFQSFDQKRPKGKLVNNSELTIWKVLKIYTDCKVGVHILAKNSKGKVEGFIILPWAKLIQVPESIDQIM